MNENTDSVPVDDAFPIVGVGASAGGLEALEQFLNGVPPKSGMAFVVVQHLDPTQPGMLPELLQRTTPMQVIQITDSLVIQPNCVYVIPPGHDLSLLHRTLFLLEPHAPRGLRLPIDFFFRSLADDLHEKSIGVVLSGMGSDGTIGLRAIKEKGGLVIVQDPASAKFDGMPRSAIDARLADIVAPAEDLPEKILAFARHLPVTTEPEPQIESGAENAFDKIVILLRARTGHDFSLYKKNTVNRRIERRMAIHQIERIATYVRFLQENPPELDLLFRELLIGVTNFFRDPAVWETLGDRVIPDLITASPDGTTLRAWVAGCSTGEEAFSLAIVFREALGNQSPAKQCTLQIYATDLDTDAIDQARMGYYPETIATDITEERLDRFFVKEEKGYRVRKEIREMVVFAPQNIIMDPPFTRLDLLSCRNLLIYLEPEIQRKLIPLFHYALNPGGVLILGTAESIGTFTDLFSSLDAKLRLYRKVQPPLPAPSVEFPTVFFPPTNGTVDPRPTQKPVVNLQSLADQVILQQYAPAAVLTSDTGDILYINGRTGRFLEPAAGKANWNIFAMARDGLRSELGGAFRHALLQEKPVALRGVRIVSEGVTVHTDVTIQKLTEPSPLKGLVLIVLADVPPTPEAPVRVRHTGRREEMLDLKERLRQSEEDLRITREEMQSSQEELKSTNEELQSTNEELQSTNEELTTSKEEMQSLNEELQTVNTELESRVADLSHVNDDMKNLLNSTNIATVFLDNQLNLRWYTAGMTKLVNLLPGDVGRPVTDIASDLFYPDLIRDAGEVLRTLIPVETEVTVRDGHRFSVHITPYRTLENRIDGVVITFADITAFRRLEQELSRARTYAEAIVATIREPLLVLDSEMHVVSANRSFFETFQVSQKEVEGRELSTLGDGEWDIPELQRLLGTILPENAVFSDLRVDHIFPTIGRRLMLLNARRIITEGGNTELILLAFEDVTDRVGADSP
ncbi:chemotaxis protein CheB [Methanosphaerula palustris]|uniref:protein-glutamate O-methyltransferase n=1 Tax=Methanosphaerula palustris (strain ATCC BAA-1556 / DSM 19958 / E1-9c) TaxID=521011 RepID=B8GEN6_METPE|nr:chemotaxis protein CheB [Methanosphaerula palustris]ACL17737.1 MCP methyltransferase/methylesterase, CheR/CheB with PAS/PAC sensor [Methanosphaerula palustris E1-9c]